MSARGPELPPLLAGRAVGAAADAFEQACTQARRGKAEAGDFFWSRSGKRAECAIVLEPEVPLARALQMGPLLQVALADTLGALLPPRIPVHLRWPDAILVNHAVAGRSFLGAPAVEPGAVPDWLVAGFRLMLVHQSPDEPGHTPDATALGEEGAGDLKRDDILHAFAAHFLTRLDAWQSDGFAPVRERWLALAEGAEEPASFAAGEDRFEGRVIGLDDDLRLAVAASDGALRRLGLAPAVAFHGSAAAPVAGRR